VLIVLAVVAVALSVRVAHVVYTERYNPLASNPALDGALYDKWARAIVEHGAKPPTRVMQAPLYPWFLALVYKILGFGLVKVRLVQAILGSLTCLFITLVTMRLFGSAVAGLISGLAAALYRPFIFYEGVLVPATLIVFLNALLILILVYSFKPMGSGNIDVKGAFDPAHPERRKTNLSLFLSALAAGIALGMSVIAKPVALFLVPFAFIHIYLWSKNEVPIYKSTGTRPKRTETPRYLPLTALTMGILLSISSLAIRNAILTHEFIPLTTGGGINFYIGHNPSTNGFYAQPEYKGKKLGATPVIQWIKMKRIASYEENRTLGPTEVSRFWTRKGLEYIGRHPKEELAMLWRKFIYFWNGYERANVENIYFHERFPGPLHFPLIPFGIAVPIAVIGIFLTTRFARSLWFLYGGVISYLAAALIFYVLARYRLPVLPFLLPFAGAAVVELSRLAVKKRIGELALSLIALALLFYLSNMVVAADTPATISNNYLRLGYIYIDKGDTTNAVTSFERSLELNPYNTRSRLMLKRLRK